jgi:hypothetical protein
MQHSKRHSNSWCGLSLGFLSKLHNIDLLSERDNSQHTQRSFEKLFGDAAAAAAEGMLQQRET